MRSPVVKHSLPILGLTILLSTLPLSTAVDIRFFVGANCGGSISSACPNWPIGSCGGGPSRLWGSVLATGPVVNPRCNRLITIATSSQAGNPCAVILGSTPGCFSAQNNAIQGGCLDGGEQLQCLAAPTRGARRG